MLTRETIRRLPKVLLHDHLDGGLRPATLIDLAAETPDAPALPASDPDRLAAWYASTARAGSHEAYVDKAEPVVALLQTAPALKRAAVECAQDLAADGVVYAEVKFAPEQHTRGGLTRQQAVAAVIEGLRVGSARARQSGQDIDVRLLLTALRQAADSMEIADLAVRNREHGVVGFDIAGPEAGYPPTRHISACEYIKRENFNLTLHAGEGFGLSSIWEAIQWCGADRLGNAVRITDDITVGETAVATWGVGAGVPDAKLGSLAAYVRDRRVPLELCPTANVCIGAVGSLAEHPVDLLRRLRFRVTVNTDNRLFAATTLTDEFHALSEVFGYTLEDMRWFTVNAMKSAFIGHDERLAVINRIIKPAYGAERAAGVQAAFFRREDLW